MIIHDELEPGESIVAEGKIAKFIYFSLVIWFSLGILLLFLSMVVGFIFISIGCIQFLKAKYTKIIITTQRLIAKKGPFLRDTFCINLSNVESINIKQHVFGKTFSYGSLIIISAGESRIRINYIDKPHGFRQN